MGTGAVTARWVRWRDSTLHVRFDIADFPDEAGHTRGRGEPEMLVEECGALVDRVDDDVAASGLLACCHGTRQGVVEQDSAKAAAVQFAAEGKPRQQDGWYLPWVCPARNPSRSAAGGAEEATSSSGRHRLA
jgi:hypothetical protein